MDVRFDRFRFDYHNRRLADASGPIALNPKAFEVLHVLLQHTGRLVSKDALLDAVWGDAHVSDGVLKVSIAELRRALGDSAGTPRYIETVHRRGYRFLVPVETEKAAVDTGPRVAAPVVWPAGGAPSSTSAVSLVGREDELAVLGDCLARALAGERQLVFVTGEAGAGKTALVEQFVARVAARGDVAITGGQCLEQFGSSEAYMPILESVGRLARAYEPMRPLLRRYAPTWLAQLPWLIEEEDRERLSRELLGSARERMLREMAELVEAVSEVTPLVVVIDDYHWSDPSTVDLTALIAGRRERARFLGVMTYRPAEVVLTGHPLRGVVQRLVAAGRGTELTLDELDVDAVQEYLARRFPAQRFPADLARLVRKHTDGNPLFLVTLVDHLLAQGVIFERDGSWHVSKEIRGELAAVPESLRRLIGQRLERLAPEDRELLEAASLVGVEFSSAIAAAGAGRDPAEAEERFARQAAAGPLLRSTGSVPAPDGTAAESFAFRHPLYREQLAAGVTARRRADVHLRIGSALERVHGVRAGQLADELAVHFEEGGNREKAVDYRRLAAEVAAARHAFPEAERHIERGLDIVASMPASLERDREELSLQGMIGAVRMATRGYAAPEVGEAYTRALELSRGAEGPSAFPILWGIWVFHAVGGELDRALELAERNRVIAYASGDRFLRLEAHHGLWTTHLFRGEWAAALEHLDQGEPLYEPGDSRAALVYGQDPKMAAQGYRSLVLWATGHPDQALEASRQSLGHARALGHPMSVAQAMVFAAWIRVLRREADAAREHAEEAIDYSSTHELPFWLPNGFEIRGWALVEQGRVDEGLAEWTRGVELWNAVRGSLGRTAYDSMFAEAHARAGRVGEARALLEKCKALVARSGERYAEPEIQRIESEILLAEAGGIAAAPAATRREARTLLESAVEGARRRGARMQELRAATALVRLANAAESRGALAALVAAFTEGLDTADLRDARNLLI
jgi:DNA-binding winged helix-turn-helix (wHTH) protein/predicted ATPase